MEQRRDRFGHASRLYDPGEPIPRKRSDFLTVPLDRPARQSSMRAMGFNRRKMEDQRRQAAEKESAARRATDAQILEDAERLIAAWNERQEKQMPMLFSPTIGAAIAARYWFLWVRCPACRTINAIDRASQSNDVTRILPPSSRFTVIVVFSVTPKRSNTDSVVSSLHCSSPRARLKIIQLSSTRLVAAKIEGSGWVVKIWRNVGL
jgi:hypothetical protein